MFMGRADIDVEYARFKDLGRTDAMRPLNNTTVVNGQVTSIGTNQIGRYPIHAHHLMGPENATNTGYQYKLIGNTVEHSTKWSITIHDTAFGLIQDNVMYDAQGTGFMAEDGSEIENVIERNFTMKISGTQDEGTDGTAGTAVNDLAAGRAFGSAAPATSCAATSPQTPFMHRMSSMVITFGQTW